MGLSRQATQALIFTLCLLPMSAATAGVYKCKDKDGNTEFSSYPCSDQAKKVDVNVASGATGSRRPGLSWEERQLLADIEDRKEDVARNRRHDAYQEKKEERKEQYQQARCDWAREYVDDVREDNKRGYSARHSRYHKDRIKHAKKHKRDAC